MVLLKHSSLAKNLIVARFNFPYESEEKHSMRDRFVANMFFLNCSKVLSSDSDYAIDIFS